MFRKVAGILLAIAIVTSSIGYHVVRHHCIWCGGDRIELVSVPAQEESDDSCCHGEPDQTHDDCDKDGCCLPGLLKLDQAVTSADDHHQVKTFNTTPVIHQFYLPGQPGEGFLNPSNQCCSSTIGDPPFRIQSGRIFAFRC